MLYDRLPRSGATGQPADDLVRADAARLLRQLDAAFPPGCGVLAHLSSRFDALAQYPDAAGQGAGGVWDAETGAQYFYHRHESGGRFPGEHGHFHLFLGEASVPAGLSPLLLPEMALAPAADRQQQAAALRHLPTYARAGYTHLVGIALDSAGTPIGLFSTNRWVTGETWFRAADCGRCVRAFGFSNPGPVEGWLVALVQVLSPAIDAVLAARDEAIMSWRRKRMRTAHVFEDRRLEICAERRIDYRAELAAAQRMGGG